LAKRTMQYALYRAAWPLDRVDEVILGNVVSAGLGMALAAGLCGLGQGKATASATEALARNPGARPGIFTFLILGLAFIESLALFTFVIIFLKVQA
jgi:F-type H+-transporting ATPase subunit c